MEKLSDKNYEYKAKQYTFLMTGDSQVVIDDKVRTFGSLSN